nr:MAG TPA: hypothetical protein [Caudoviricetes sp.]
MSYLTISMSQSTCSSVLISNKPRPHTYTYDNKNVQRNTAIHSILLVASENICRCVIQNLLRANYRCGENQNNISFGHKPSNLSQHLRHFLPSCYNVFYTLPFVQTSLLVPVHEAHCSIKRQIRMNSKSKKHTAICVTIAKQWDPIGWIVGNSVPARNINHHFSFL